MYSGKVKCTYGESSYIFITGEIYEIKDGKFISGKTKNNESFRSITINFDTVHSINCNLSAQFEEVKSVKIELLSKNGFELINGNFRYYLYLETNINKFNELEIYYRYDNNERIIHQIRWGKVYNTTFNDIKSVLDALNIEIIEAPKYTIDSSKEYTEEEMLKLSELGVKFKEI